jgi:hypothetical protein
LGRVEKRGTAFYEIPENLGLMDAVDFGFLIVFFAPFWVFFAPFW